MESQLELFEDKDNCCVCNQPILEDGKGMGITGISNGIVTHVSYHRHCYNAEQLKQRNVRKKDYRASKHSTSKTG